MPQGLKMSNAALYVTQVTSDIGRRVNLLKNHIKQLSILGLNFKKMIRLLNDRIHETSKYYILIWGNENWEYETFIKQ